MIYGCGAQVCLRGTFDPGEAISLIQAQVAASSRGGCVRFQMHGAPGGLRTSAVWVRDLLAAVEIDDADLPEGVSVDVAPRTSIENFLTLPERRTETTVETNEAGDVIRSTSIERDALHTR
jgi:hypothetical protein